MKLRVVVRAVIALLFACSAAFAQGRVERFEVDFLDGPFVVTQCDGFSIMNYYAGTGRIAERYDRDGNFVQGIYHFTYTENVFYNSEDPSIRVEGVGGEQNLTRDAGGVYYNSGSPIRVIVPGEGLVVSLIGHYAYDYVNGQSLFHHGPAGFWEGDFEALCRLLTPE